LHRLSLTCALLSTLYTTAVAHAQTSANGIGPDLSTAGGVGFGLDSKIDNNFFGRLRLGVLYAFEPYFINGGLTLEAGALSNLAIGGEIEANSFHGLFANLGLSYSRDAYVTGHVSAGYTIFGLEYQHAFADRKPREALLFVVRFPLGFWWFTRQREEKKPPPPPPPGQSAAGSGTAAAPAPVGTQENPLPLGPTAPSPSGTPAPTTPIADPATRERMERGQHAQEEALMAGVRGDYTAQSDALRRAYAAQADPMLLVRIADADIARGKRALAAQALQQFLATTATADGATVAPVKVQAEAKLNELLPQLARVRVTYAAASGDEVVAIDGAAQPGALLGYDLLLDPGQHVLTLSTPARANAGAKNVEKTFEARPGELVRIEL
jgi:hypothetical protein